MDLGFYVQAAGILGAVSATKVISNNIANSESIGYIADRDFYTSYIHGHKAKSSVTMPSSGLFLLNSQGTFECTGRTLDVAIDGRGFFAVQTKNGRMFSRAGRFHLNAQGTLVNSDGFAVLGPDGSQIELEGSESNIRIDGNGLIIVGGKQVGEIGVFALNGKPSKSFLGYVSSNAVDIVTNPKVIQGSVEKANIGKMELMANLAEANNKVHSINKLFEVDNELFKKLSDVVSSN